MAKRERAITQDAEATAAGYGDYGHDDQHCDVCGATLKSRVLDDEPHQPWCPEGPDAPVRGLDGRPIR